MSHTSPQTVGILGGMGPYATSLFFQNVLALTPATKDWDHLRVVIDSNPHIPSRSRHYLFGEASPLPGMIDVGRRLAAYPVDFIVLPCNSASSFLPDLQAQVPVPILDIFAVTVAALKARVPEARRVVVLGGAITYGKRTYAPYLDRCGMKLVDHGPTVQRETELLIERAKLHQRRSSAVRRLGSIINRLVREDRADAVVLGCTEFGFLAPQATPVPVVDSNLELARATVVRALGGG